MHTEKCLYCDRVFDEMKGKLLIQVKTPDDAVPLSKVYISEKKGFFSISLAPGSVYIYDVEKPMNVYAMYSLGKSEVSSEVRIEPEEFTHLVVDYEYFYCHNQARVKKVRLNKIEHRNHDDL